MTALFNYDYLKDKLGNPRTLTGVIGLTAVASNPVQALMKPRMSTVFSFQFFNNIDPILTYIADSV